MFRKANPVALSKQRSPMHKLAVAVAIVLLSLIGVTAGAMLGYKLFYAVY